MNFILIIYSHSKTRFDLLRTVFQTIICNTNNIIDPEINISVSVCIHIYTCTYTYIYVFMYMHA